MDYLCFEPLIFKGKERPEYEINQLGQIRKTKDHKIIKPSTNPGGYQIVALRLNNKKWYSTVHRLVATRFIPNPLPDIRKQINHIDGDKSNNRVSNLEWCTASENIRHAVKNGLIKTKYSDELIHSACMLLEGGVKISEISRKLKIPYKTIESIKYGELRAEISELYDIPEVTPHISDEKAEEICKLIVQRLTDKEIAEICNVSKFIVDDIGCGKTHTDISKKYGIPLKRRSLSDETVHSICKLIDEGYKNNEITKLLNVSIDSVKGIKYDGYYYDISNEYKFMKNKKKRNKINNFKNLYPDIDRMLLARYKTKEIVRALNIPDGQYQSFKSVIVKRRNKLRDMGLLLD